MDPRFARRGVREVRTADTGQVIGFLQDARNLAPERPGFAAVVDLASRRESRVTR
jgi:hypothetical protein